MITRAEVIRRAATLWAPGAVPYNQSAIHGPTGYRQDCSGFVSMCWGIPANASPGGWGGLNTVTLVTGGYMTEIKPSDLQPGDAVGICGPATGGDDGHIVLFERWLNDDPNDDRYWAYEQAGGQKGPIHRVITYPYSGAGGPWKSYRFRDIADTPTPPTPTPGGTTMSDFTPLQPPAAIKLNGVTRGDSLGIWDVWGHEMLGHSPYGPEKSYRGAQLDRIEAFAKAAAGANTVTLTPEQVTAIAQAVADALPQDATAHDIAAELISQLGGASSE